MDPGHPLNGGWTGVVALRRVEDLNASRRHCRFTIAPPAVRVHDLGSRHGTHVNGVPVDEHDLADGDEVRIGATIVRIAVTPAEFAGYSLEEELGRGAQGTVFLTRHDHGGPAAVKVLHDMTPRTAASTRCWPRTGRCPPSSSGTC